MNSSIDQINSTFSVTYSNNMNDSVIGSLSIFLIIIFVLGILFNVVSLIAIIKSKIFHPINILIMNLALADIVYISSIPLFVMNAFTHSWPFDIVGCRIFFLTDLVGMIVGVYTVTALSVERYIEIKDKKKRLQVYSNKFKLLVVLIYLTILWIFAIMFALPMIFSIQTKESDSTLACDTKWSESELNMFFTLKFMLSFIIPFSIITFSSTKLLLFLSRWNRSNTTVENTVECPLDNRTKNKLNKTKKNKIKEKAVKIVLSIVLLFFIQWIPLWLTELYKALSNNLIDNIQLISSIITLISYSNSISNPLLYLFLTVNFRKHLTELLKIFKK